MTQIAPETLRRVRRDPRFRGALDVGVVATDWRNRGACLGTDPEMFFPTVADDPAPAVAICRGCPVQAPCLAAALATGECDGVWGATIPDERRIMRRAWDRFSTTR